MTPNRIVDRALELEAEGVDPAAALEQASREKSPSPGVKRMAAAILRSLASRAGRVECVLPDRDRRGRFVPTRRTLEVAQ